MSIFKSNGLKRRAIYKYACSGCGKQRASFIYERALGKVCTACQKGKPNENQPDLFIGVDISKDMSAAVLVDRNGVVQDIAYREPQEEDEFFSESEAEYAIKKVNEQRKLHQEEQKNKQYNQVLDAEVDGEQTKRDQFFEKHGSNITVQKEVVEEDVLLFTFNDRAGLYVTGEYFRWKVVDFFANAEYFMDDLPLVYSAGLEVDLVLAKQ